MIDTLSYNLNLVLIKINIFTSYLISLNRAPAFANVFTIIINNILFLQQDSCLTKVSSIVWQQKGQYIKLRLLKPSWIFQLQLLQFYTHIYIYILQQILFLRNWDWILLTQFSSRFVASSILRDILINLISLSKCIHF